MLLLVSIAYKYKDPLITIDYRALRNRLNNFSPFHTKYHVYCQFLTIPAILPPPSTEATFPMSYYPTAKTMSADCGAIASTPGNRSTQANRDTHFDFSLLLLLIPFRTFRFELPSLSTMTCPLPYTGLTTRALLLPTRPKNSMPVHLCRCRASVPC